MKTLIDNNLVSGQALVRLVKQFGTHVPTTVVMGARYGQQSEVTAAYLASKSITSIKASAELSVSSVLSTSAMYASNSEQAEEFSRTSTSQSMYTMGSAPPSNGDALAWASSVFTDPAPIQSSGWMTLDAFSHP